jgi:putative tryptophan/tyrosine transport system substrate-binding protein
MRRRSMLALTALFLSAPFAAIAQQQKIYRIGYLAADPNVKTASQTFRAFVDGLQKLGWVEGKNIELRIKTSSGRTERYPELAAELVRENVDVIVATGSASIRAAKAATDRIPIVFGSAANPVEQKFVGSLARPGGNVTGLATLREQVASKRLQLLKEIVPKASRVARLYSPTNMVGLHDAITQEYKVAATALGLDVHSVPVTHVEQIDAAFAAAVRNGANAVIVEPEPIFTVDRRAVAALALKHRLPLMSGDLRLVEAGALAAYSPDFVAQYARAAFYVDRILRGANPADLPVELPTAFSFALNMKTAAALSLALPESVVIQADRLIR